jgi:tetratricopeptide (TPR) repeat protein
VRAPWTPLLLLLLACPARAEAPEPAFEAVREGLLSPGRGARESAARRAREIARTDPAGVAALWDGLDLEGRCHLVRALGAAGTRHAAEVAHARATAPEPEIFRALLDGLAEGGEASLFAPAPEGLPAARARALEEMRFRYRVEAELLRLKSPSGPTGHYVGQFKRVKALGRGVIPVLLDITMDRASSLPGEGAAGPYRSIHEGMVAFDPQELREMTAYGFGEVVEKDDLGTMARLLELYQEYDRADKTEFRFEREELAPSIAYSLHDLGVTGPAVRHINRLKRLEPANWNEEIDRYWELGYACIRIGRHDEGAGYYHRVLAISPSKAIAAYNLACSFSMRAAEASDEDWRETCKQEALDFLAQAIEEHNYGDWKWMEEDGDLAFIRGEPRYQELLRHLQRKYPERTKGKVPKGRSFLAPR